MESGPDNFGLPTVTNPALYRAALAPGTANALHYKSRKEEQLSDREVIVTTGGLLGGSSSVNGMIYQRAQLCDFDSWDTKGWSGKEVLPFLKKVQIRKHMGRPWLLIVQLTGVCLTTVRDVRRGARQ